MLLCGLSVHVCGWWDVEVRVLAYRDLEDKLVATVLGLKGVENGGELLGVELDCGQGVSDNDLGDDIVKIVFAGWCCGY